MKITKPLVTAALAATLGVGVVACGGSSDSGSEFFGFSSPVLSQEGQKFTAEGVEAAAQELGWEAQVYDANLSPDTQVSNLQTMVDRPASAIGAWALDEGAISGAYSRADAAGIPVIGINSGGTGVDASVWTESTTCEPGGVIDRLADYYAEAKPNGTIAIMSGPPAPSIVTMTDCFTEAAENKGLNIVVRQDNTADTSASASALAQDMLSANPSIDGFWSYNDGSALGIGSAMQARGLTAYSPSNPEGIVVTGNNGDEAAIAAVRNGTISATIDTDPVCTGWAMVAAARDAIDGTAQPEYVVAGTIVDGETITDYVAPADRDCSLDDLPLVETDGNN
ncbi:substrate-binding domain-containing protein [Gordonia sp. HNM0687]|uniref:Substrate-binding domain-containing protein n=1 Tax=Gordonia mangrovi TaxID=2665643 RepID=A0A6L7GS49_9ACTN|nr:sugar ABC transporter substrate-binding protein [Gordonia mangrovi]MXP22799.1 substrate-binding domain-containing protein [Gordonia mangrovi]UVF77114.1 sugar ABC transporter substrate-binding protein [Gordonia mangrovi]